MKMKYVEKVKTKISIEASKKTANLLEGLYRSVYKGRSLDFDDLRSYVLGDNTKDIDWKSSIRHGSLLVRRYIALKKHNVLFVVDSGIKMSGVTKNNEVKKDVAVLTLGVLGYIINKNEDEFAFLYGNSNNIDYVPFKSGINNLEISLSKIDKNIINNNSININKLLEYLLSNIKRKMIIIVVTDIGGFNSLNEDVIKKISLSSDLLFINIEDSLLFGDKAFDIENNSYIPSILTKNKKLSEYELKLKNDILLKSKKIFDKYRISFTNINSENEVVSKIIELLERHNYVIKH